MFASRSLTFGLRAASRRTTPGVAAFHPMRTYATANTPPVDSKPPVALFGVDGTYANALYTASTKSSALPQTAAALESLGRVFKRDPKLIGLLNAPTLSGADKLEITKELGKVAGGPQNEIFTNFLATLAENNRLGCLKGVCEKFAVLMGAHRGELELVVTSAQPLDKKSLDRIEAAVAKSEYSQGKKLKVVTKINTDLVGGLVVEIGDRTVDLSISSKLAKMNKALSETV